MVKVGRLLFVCGFLVVDVSASVDCLTYVDQGMCSNLSSIEARKSDCPDADDYCFMNTDNTGARPASPRLNIVDANNTIYRKEGKISLTFGRDALIQKAVNIFWLTNICTDFMRKVNYNCSTILPVNCTNIYPSSPSKNCERTCGTCQTLQLRNITVTQRSNKQPMVQLGEINSNTQISSGLNVPVNISQLNGVTGSERLALSIDSSDKTYWTFEVTKPAPITLYLDVTIGDSPNPTLKYVGNTDNVIEAMIGVNVTSKMQYTADNLSPSNTVIQKIVFAKSCQGVFGSSSDVDPVDFSIWFKPKNTGQVICSFTIFSNSVKNFGINNYTVIGRGATDSPTLRKPPSLSPSSGPTRTPTTPKPTRQPTAPTAPTSPTSPTFAPSMKPTVAPTPDSRAAAGSPTVVSEQGGNGVGIAFGIIVPLLLICIVVCYVAWKKKQANRVGLKYTTFIDTLGSKLSRQSSRRRSSAADSGGVEISVSQKKFSERLQTVQTHRIDTRYLSTGKIIGNGASGVVHEGSYFDQEVAVKKLHAHIEADPNAVVDFENEAEIWKKLTFQNILQLYGVSLEPGNLCMVMEKCAMSLSDLLYNTAKHPELPWEERLVIARDIASGMFYLHEKTILHRDLKSMNVLLSKDGIVKICDFGMAKVKNTAGNDPMSVTSGVKGTPQWLAPEIAEGNGKYTRESDVYSFGIILWEIASRRLPYSDNGDESIFTVLLKILKGARPGLSGLEYPSEEIKLRFESLMTRCWSQDISQRPQFAEVLEEIKDMLNVLSGKDMQAVKEQQIWKRKGIEAYESQDFKGAIRNFTKALSFGQDDEIYAKQWYSFMNSSDSAGALAMCESWHKAFPESLTMYEKYSDTLMKKEKPGEAIHFLEEGLRRDPYNIPLSTKLKRAKRDAEASSKPN
mmetsp:Transcript_24869/g.48934  ORF Transcript_24869/g.48934 Transcript_24869/m.48934 type:complete len:905 (-) Transcript_24869:80-2794(-)